MSDGNAMTCGRADALLALHAEGDLEPAESRALDAHIREGPHCRAEAEAYRRSQAFLREVGPAPIDARDYAEIRRGVRRALAEEASRGTFVQRAANIFLEGKRGAPALAVAACLLLLAAIALRPFRPAEVSEKASIARLAGPRAEARPLSPSKETTLPPDPTLVVRDGRKPALFPSQQTKPLSDKHALFVRAAPSSVVSRIELQTTNPNVRIIWLVGAQPARPLESDPEDGI
jgi:anti-sigma factor RsiW